MAKKFAEHNGLNLISDKPKVQYSFCFLARPLY